MCIYDCCRATLRDDIHDLKVARGSRKRAWRLLGRRLTIVGGRMGGFDNDVRIMQRAGREELSSSATVGLAIDVECTAKKSVGA